MAPQMPMEAGAIPQMTKDPVANLIDEIQGKLDDLRTMVTADVAATEGPEMGQQSDEEIMAGIPPTPKKVMP